MIWVTWRQHRVEALMAGILLAIVMLALLLTGMSMASAFQSSGLARCTLQQLACNEVEGNFINSFGVSINLMTAALTILPLLAGMFIGAPLVARELEQRTYRLIWTQSITRLRWLGVKLLLIIGITLLTFITLSMMSEWWSTPWSVVTSPWSTYDVRGIVLPAYALFALALGIASGILVRRSVPAIGITIVVFLLLKLAITLLIRPYFLPPLSYISSLDQVGAPSHADLLIHIGTIDRNGQEISDFRISEICPQLSKNGSSEAFSAFRACEQKQGFQSKSYYQPASRFWLFQAIEATIFLLLAVALLAPTAWLVSKKIT